MTKNTRSENFISIIEKIQHIFLMRGENPPLTPPSRGDPGPPTLSLGDVYLTRGMYYYVGEGIR